MLRLLLTRGADRGAEDVLGCPFGSRLGVVGTGSVDLDLLDVERCDLAGVRPFVPVVGVSCTALPSSGDGGGCATTWGGVLFMTVDLANTFSRTMLVPSSNTDSSSGPLSCSSRMGEMVATTLLLFSIERATSSRSGLSSSCSASSAPGCALGEPRFLLPNCGVTVLALAVLLRLDAPLRWSDALLGRCAEPFGPRGVFWTGVRRDDGRGESEACLAGGAPRAPKLKPKEACTEEGLRESVLDCLRVMCNVSPSTAHALLSMFAAIYGCISTESMHT